MGLERTSVIMQKEILQMKKRSLHTDYCEALLKQEGSRRVFEQQPEGPAVVQESYRNKDFDVFDGDEIEREIRQATPMNVLVEELREQQQKDISSTSFYLEIRRRFPAKKIVTLKKSTSTS